MKKITQITIFIAVMALVVPAFADILVLKSGEKITGYYQGGTARVIKFQTADGMVKDYDLLQVQQIQFGDSSTASTAPPPPASTPAPAPASPAAAAPAADPRLLPGNQRVTRPASSTAANTGYTVATGSKVVIRMIDAINSEKNKAGEVFVATLDEPIT